MKLRPQQEKGADFQYEHDRSLILAPVGSGKTAMTLTAMADMLRDGVVKRWLVIAPKRVAVEVWPVEAKKWQPNVGLRVAVGSPTKRNETLAGKAKIVVTNYDNIQTLPDLKSFDGIVFDELTKLKNPSGKRFKHLMKLIEHINIRIGLTGSFTSNGLEDVFGQCKIVDDVLLGKTKQPFLNKYFICINPEYGEFIPRKGALQQVMEAIRPAVYTIDTEEYVNTLPPLHTVEVRCDLDDREPYEKMKRDYVADLKGEQITALSAAAVTSKLQQMSSGFAYQSHTFASDTPGKMDSVKKPVWFSKHKFDRLDEVIEENQHANTLIFYNFVEEFEELKRRYPQAQTLDDKNAVQRWNAGEIEILLAHPKSAQFGLNLQDGGSKVVFLSLPWSLIDFEQAVGRLHRSGQKHAVYCYVMLTNKTIDERIWASLHDKKALSTLAMEELK